MSRRGQGGELDAHHPRAPSPNTHPLARMLAARGDEADSQVHAALLAALPTAHQHRAAAPEEVGGGLHPAWVW